jgi:hypothetical protein
LTVGAYFDQALGQRVSKSSSSTHHGRGARVIFFSVLQRWFVRGLLAGLKF